MMAGPLKNNRRELLAQGLFSGKTMNQAYADAGYKAHNANASMLNHNAEVVARVRELKEHAVERIIAPASLHIARARPRRSPARTSGESMTSS